jgi:hypothetical protein
MKITIEPTLEDDVIARFYDIYRAAFQPMQTRAAARHTLSAEEFAEEMLEERIDKYIAWSADDTTPVGLTTLTNDLTTVPWIEPKFAASRHPDELARGTLFYLGYTLVAPDADTFGVFKAMSDSLLQRVAEARGVLGFDVSAYNARRAIGRAIAKLPETFGAEVNVVDTQTYYLADFSRPKAD